MNAANLSEAILTGADLTGANLLEVSTEMTIGADFTGALNIPAEYLKD
ncbi:pentapeptide repeat-containing protein [SAR202 cluster bacterium AD-802-F09_MRT_200m]|nr:pentapeptide repeat-containing protein [SAR202 cluster bacterium AD-802-F09_MRT_200m]